MEGDLALQADALLNPVRLWTRAGASRADSLPRVAGREVVPEEAAALDGERGEHLLQDLVRRPERSGRGGHQRRQRLRGDSPGSFSYYFSGIGAAPDPATAPARPA